MEWGLKNLGPDLFVLWEVGGLLDRHRRGDAVGWRRDSDKDRSEPRGEVGLAHAGAPSGMVPSLTPLP